MRKVTKMKSKNNQDSISKAMNVPMPKNTCTDEHCPFHGHLKVHGRRFVGTVKSAKAMRTVTVEFEWRRKIQKYQRYETRRTKIKAHSPPCLDPKEGASVTIMETRPLSKTKCFVVIQVHDDLKNAIAVAKSK